MVPFYTAPSARLLSFVGLFFGFGSGPRCANEANRDCKLFFLLYMLLKLLVLLDVALPCFFHLSIHPIHPWVLCSLPTKKTLKHERVPSPCCTNHRLRLLPATAQKSSSDAPKAPPSGMEARPLMHPEGQGLIASGLVCVAFVYFFQHPASAFNNSFSSHEEAAEISSASVLYPGESSFRYENGDFWRIRISLVLTKRSIRNFHFDPETF